MQIFAKKVTKWVAIANGREGRILVIKGNQLLNDKKITLNNDKARLPSREIASDKPGRSSESGRSTPHAYEPKITEHLKAKIKFADDLAKLLNKAFIEESFDDLILVASPEFLGEIRASLNKAITNKISNEINKDLTHMEDAGILKAIGVKYSA
jgi:protein required for attachment to host cells